MDIGLLIAGVVSVGLAAGHELVGRLAVLPAVTEDRLPGTIFGPSSMTVVLVQVTWRLVSVFVAALGGLLITLALGDGSDPKTVALRWLAAMWIVATAVAVWSVRRHPSLVLRLPVPLTWPFLALLCWNASN